MLKRYRSLLISLSLVAMAIPTFMPINTIQAQTRRVMLEEFTGAWCGWCVRGALSIEQLRETYPGQVIAVSFHNDNGNPVNDMMDTPQGDTLASGISSLSSATAVTGFPDGWTARTPVGSSWNVDPGAWIDTLNGTGYAEQLLGQGTSVAVTLDQISYDEGSGNITARVNATFNQPMSGNLRFNLYLIEDSVTGTGTGWDQHNYYYQNPSFPTSPYYDMGTGAAGNGTIPGFMHMQVFRYSPGPIWGTSGVIPSSVAKGKSYSQVYTFPIPASVLDPTHVKLIGFVSEYSASNLAGNQILDADMEPLIGPGPKYLLTAATVASDAPYNTAISNGTTTENVSFTSNGPDTIQVSLSIDPSALPNGWSATLSPNTLTLNPWATGKAVLTVNAPEQSAFTSINVFATPAPAHEGDITFKTKTTAYLLSDNTRYALYVADGSVPESAAVLGLPDSVSLHTATMPLTLDIMTNYDYSQYGAVFLNNIPILDFSADLGLGVTSSVQMINDMLSAGAKVFINSDDALGYAFDNSDGYFSQYSNFTETDAVQSLYEQMGIDFTKTVRNWNANTGNLTPFAIAGEKGDPIGNGLSVTNAGGYLSEIFSIDSNSSPVFYSSGKAANIIGARYVDSSTGGRLVYLGFGLSELTNQKLADTIATRSIAWLFGNGTAGVAQQTAPSATGITASPNPFSGISQIQYTAATGESNVTFSAYDLLGRQVSTLAATNVGGNVYTANFDASKLANGTYVIVAHTSKGSQEIRVVNQQ